MQSGMAHIHRAFFTPSLAGSSSSETSSSARISPGFATAQGAFKTREASTILAPHGETDTVRRMLPASHVKNPGLHDVIILASSIQATSAEHAGGHVVDTVCRYPSLILGSGATFVARKVAVPCQCVESGFVVVKTPKLPSKPGRSENDWGTHLKRILFELRALRHEHLMYEDNIVRLEGITWIDDPHDLEMKWPALVLEYGNAGTLADLLIEESLSQDAKIRICLDVANGLRALHSCGIVHSDLKSENVLMFRSKSREYIAKIGDFGCSIAENPSGAYLAGGTPPWTAPEWRSWIPTEELSKTDVYSFGLLVWRVMSGEHDPWKTILPSQTTSQSVTGKARIEELKRDADVLLHMLESNIRPTLSRSIEHAIIESLRHTVRLDPKKRDLDIAIALLLSVVKHGSERQTNGDSPHDMGDMCRDIWKTMKEMIPGEFTETMIWTLCGKISDSANISIPEMRELKTRNNNRVDEKFFEMFTEMASRKSTSRGMMGQRRIDEIRVLVNENEEDAGKKNNLSPDLVASELSCFSASHVRMLQPVIRKQIEESLTKAANAGEQDAALFLVVYYLNIAFDAEAACSWLVRAAELRSSSAMYLCYRIHKGLGIPVPDRIKDRIDHWLYTGTCWGSRIAFQDLRVVHPTLAVAAGCILQKQGSCNGDILFRDAAMAGPFAMDFDSLDVLAEKIRRDGRRLDEIILAGENGDRLLHWAAGAGNSAAIEALVRTHGADINVRNKKGETPFLASVRSGSGRTMAKLLQLGADPTIASDSGQVPLHWLWGLEGTNRLNPSFKQEVQELTILAVGMSRENRRVLNAIADAVTTRINGFKDVKQVHRLQTHIFSELPAGTPLHWAVQRRSLAAVKALLAAGADPKTDSAGAVAASGIAENRTVWHLAAAMHDDDILQMLVDNMQERERGITPEEVLKRLPENLLAAATDGFASRSYANGRFERIARHGDSYKARTKKTFNLLWSLGLHDLGDRYNIKVTPLFLAVQAGQTDIVEALLQTMFQQDLHVRSGAGFTPLQESLNRRADDIYFLLRSHEADVLAEWGSRGGKHGTLALCALAGHYKTTVAADLIRSGVPVRSPTPDILSPFVLAVHGGHFRLARFLLDQGADVNELQDNRVNMLSFSRLGRPTTALGLLLLTSDYSNLLPISWLLDQQKQGKLPTPLSPIVCPSIGMNAYHALGFVDEDGRDDDVVEQIFRLLWGAFPDRKLLNSYFHVSDKVGTVAPLYLAVETSNPQLVAAFLKAGADPTTKNSKGYGPVGMAVQFADDFEREVRKGTISEGMKPDKMASVPKMLARRRRVRDVLLEAVNLGASKRY